MQNIEIQRLKLISEGLKENIDFRIVYFGVYAEIKYIKKVKV